MDFSEKLKAIREEKGISQSDLARKTGVGRSTICSYESGRRTKITAPIVQAIANALEIPWQLLVAGTDIQNQTALAIDGHVSINTTNNKTAFNGVLIMDGNEAHKQSHVDMLQRRVEDMSDDSIIRLVHIADSMKGLSDAKQEEVLDFARFLEQHTNH